MTVSACGHVRTAAVVKARQPPLDAGRSALAEARFAEARRAFQEALQGARGRADARGAARALTWLARTARAQGRPMLAIALTKEALGLYGQVDDKAGAADAHAELAQASLDAGDFGEAREEFLWAIAHARAAGDREREGLARTGLARVAVIHGAFAQAASEADRAERLAAVLEGAAAGRVAGEVGAIRGEIFDFARGQPQLERSIAALTGAGDRRSAAAAWLALGRLHVAARRLAAGRDALEQAVRTARQLASTGWAATTAHEGGDVLAGAGDEEGAARLYGTAARLYAQAGEREGEALVEVSLAALDLGRSRARAARPRLERAAAALERLGDRYAAGEACILLARARIQLGDATGGAREAQRALEHAAELSAPELVWRAYGLLGYLTETLLDREAEAARFYRGALTAIETIRAGIDFLGREGAGAVGGTAEEVYYRMARLRIREHRRSGEARPFDQAIATLEQARSRDAFDLLARAGATLADTPAQQRRARALAGEERAIALMLVRPGVAADTRRSLRLKLERIRAARAAEEQRALRFAAAQAEPVTADIVRRAVDPDEAVLAYFLGPDGSILMVFTRDGTAAFDLPGRDVLTRLTLAWRRAVIDRDIRRSRAASGELVPALLGGARAMLAGKRRVVVVPHGPLWLVPFAGLSDRKGYLGQRLAFTYAPSLSSWLRARFTPHGRDAARELLALAGARPGPSPAAAALTVKGFTLATPPRAAREVWVAAAAFGADNCTVLSAGAGEEALDGARLEDYRRIHLAAPAVYPPTVSGALQPAVALGGGGRADGLLQLREIVALSMPVSVVAIGALEAPPDLSDGASIEALARAFQLAGAGAVILPVWEPDDTSAAELWTAFYAGLKRGVGASEALAEAQRAVAKRHPQPRSFAPFVLVGAEGVTGR